MRVEPCGFGVEGVGDEPSEGHWTGLRELERQSQRFFKQVAAQSLAADAGVDGEAHEQNARNRKSCSRFSSGSRATAARSTLTVATLKYQQ